MTGANKFNDWLRRIQDLLRPSRTIPTTSWRAPSTWGLFSGNQRFQRLMILIFGLTIFGIGEAFLVITSLGNSPWVVLSQGISLNSNLNIGQATFFVSFLVLILWIPLKQKPGFGTLANMVVIAAAIELGLLIIPETTNLAIKYFYILLGIALVGIGSALYITCGLGTGPRDGLMTGLHYRTGVRVGRVRLGIEVLALSSGALLGGSLGVGTALFALLIGQSVAISLGVLARLTSK
ncbi:MAG: YczE/YyaS/YitT family protein [Candidatus Nanopelagicus sp.]